MPVIESCSLGLREMNSAVESQWLRTRYILAATTFRLRDFNYVCFPFFFFFYPEALHADLNSTLEAR